MRLSICIPTYNRAPFIGQLLESILQQTDYRCELEVVISDNASSDDTLDVVERYRSQFPRLIYQCAEKNQGADRNFLKVVELASGDYCWLMGSDDVLEPGAIATIERTLRAYPTVGGAFTGRHCYDYTMTSKVAQGATGLPDTTSVMRGAETIFSELGEHIGYISGNIVDRALWNEVVTSHPLEEYFNAWIHVYVMGRMMQRRPEWIYVVEPCVGWRSGNDSFLANGQYRRLEIDIVGYEQITRALFGTDRPVYRHIMLRILRHARFRILHSKAHDAPKSFFRDARKLLSRYYCDFPSYWIGLYPLLFVPNPAFSFARAVYAKTVRRRRIAKANG